MAKKKSTKKKVKAKVIPKKIVRGSTRYRAVQTLLGKYTKASGIKLGRGFNKSAAGIYQNTKDSPLKYVEQNMDQLYKEFGVFGDKLLREFPDVIPFYNFTGTIIEPIFDGVTIGVTFIDSELSANFKGDAQEVELQYKSDLHTHLRKKYNDSPVAYFKVIDTDSKTYVNYKIITGEDVAEDVPTVAEVEENVKSAGLSTEDAKVINQELDILREKTKLASIELELLKERSNLANKALELIRAGFTKDEAMKLLGL